MRTDLLLDANEDLPIDAIGLMPVGPSDYQHQKDAFAAFPGEWKQFQFNGIGLAGYLKSGGNTLLRLESNARQQLAKDGYSTGKMKLSYNSDGQLIINTNTVL